MGQIPPTGKLFINNNLGMFTLTPEHDRIALNAFNLDFQPHWLYILHVCYLAFPDEARLFCLNGGISNTVFWVGLNV